MMAAAVPARRPDHSSGVWGTLRRVRPLTWLAIGFVKGWRAFISPLYGDVCKYEPSCSAYGLRALKVHGVFRATPMIIWRILRAPPRRGNGVNSTPSSRAPQRNRPMT